MRWGIREDASDDHSTRSVCLSELSSCKRLSVGPHFVALLGQKYGFRTFPAAIEVTVFELLRAALLEQAGEESKQAEGESKQAEEESKQQQQAVHQISLLAEWFRVDDNMVPAHYVLRSVSSKIPEFVLGESAEGQRAAREKWYGIHGALHDMLLAGAEICHQRGVLAEGLYKQFKVSSKKKSFFLCPFWKISQTPLPFSRFPSLFPLP